MQLLKLGVVFPPCATLLLPKNAVLCTVLSHNHFYIAWGSFTVNFLMLPNQLSSCTLAKQKHTIKKTSVTCLFF